MTVPTYPTYLAHTAEQGFRLLFAAVALAAAADDDE